MRKYHGFTLIELMIVITIVAIIAMIAIPALMTMQKRAKSPVQIIDLSGGIDNVVSNQAMILLFNMKKAPSTQSADTSMNAIALLNQKRDLDASIRRFYNPKKPARIIMASDTTGTLWFDFPADTFCFERRER